MALFNFSNPRWYRSKQTMAGLVDKHFETLIDEIEFEGQRFVPIVRLAALMLMVSEELIHESTISRRVNHDSTEYACILEMHFDRYAGAVSSNAPVHMFFKIYPILDIEARYQKMNEDFGATVFMRQERLFHQMQAAVNLMSWGYVKDLEIMMLKS